MKVKQLFVIFFALIIFSNSVIKGQEKRYTSEYFGVKFKPMKTVFLNNKGRLSDTIAMGRFDLFDAYSDFAVYHRGKGTIAIYSNQRNRFYEKTSEIELEKPVSKIESYLADEGVPIGLKRHGVWSLYQNQSYTYFLCQFVRKVNTAFYFQTVTGATFYGQGPYDIEVGDIDGDGKQEIVWGDCNSSGALYYIDSTGIATNSGYEAMYYEFSNQELGTGYSKLKDFDNDGKPEIIACSDAYGSGAIGVIKHTGEPGENKYQIMWPTTEGLFNAPNMGIDSGSIDGKYTILYSLMKFVSGIERLNFITFTKTASGYNMPCTSFKEVIPLP